MEISRNKALFEIEGDCFYEQSPPFNFASLEPEYSVFRDSWAVIIPVPYDATTTYRSGARDGPSHILRASGQLELFDEELGFDVYQKGICTLSPIETDVTSPGTMMEKVEKVVSHVKGQGKLPALIGGEHLVSVGAIRALSKEDDFKVVHFDAHADLRSSYQGSRYSNACVMRLVAENCEFVSIGVRSMSREEHHYIRAGNVRCIYAREVIEKKEKVLEELNDFAGSKIYITVDLDVFDPSVMPSVGTPEPGGLYWYDMLVLLKHLCRRSEIIGFDVVELLPQPGNVAPDFLAAKLIYKILSYTGYYLDNKSFL